MDEIKTKIYDKVRNAGIEVNHACEVGVYKPETSNIIDFINSPDTQKITLVEPLPEIIKGIKDYFKGNNKITLHECAIHDYNGTLDLYRAESSTFAGDLKASPALVNDKYQKNEEQKLTVKCAQFSELDSGEIDLLSVDTEGCEWYVLKHLKSQPKILSIETHGKFYENPFNLK